MANILISHASNIYDPDTGQYETPCYYESLIKTLVQAGNHVLQTITNDFIHTPWNGTNESVRALRHKRLKKIICDFNPDLVITYNNSLYDEIPNLVDCPIAVFDADLAPYFNGKEELKKNSGRYHFFCLSEDSANSVIQLFSPPKSQVHLMPFATGIKAENIVQDKNISFIGSCFNTPKSTIEAALKTQRADILRDTITAKRRHILLNTELSPSDDIVPNNAILEIDSAENRIKVLDAIADLGLCLYGPPNWLDRLDYFSSVALSYRPDKVYSLQHNQDIYNSSKLCINIPHSQALQLNCYPWRVMDVMASNGCLVSAYLPALEKQFKPYVKLPMFHSIAEARDICEALLKDHQQRRDIVAGSQQAIAEMGCIEDRIRDLGQFFSINFFPNSNTGRVTRVSSAEITTQANNFLFRLQLQFIKLFPPLPPSVLKRAKAFNKILRIPVNPKVREYGNKIISGDN